MKTDSHNFEPSLESFKDLFPCKTTRPEQLDLMWDALTPEERRRASKGVAGYAAHCRKHSRLPMDPERFLRMPGLWDEFAAVAPRPKP